MLRAKVCTLLELKPVPFSNCGNDPLPALPAHLAHSFKDQFAVVIHAVGAAPERGRKNRGQTRGLLAVEVAGIRAVVVMRCCFGSVYARTPFDDVEIKLQNAVLAEDEFCYRDKRELRAFAQERSSRSEEEIFYKLLGDGGGAAGAAAVEIVIGCDLDLMPVEAMVLVEAGVLGGHGGVLQIGRDLAEGDERIALVIGLAVNPGLQAALEVHGGGWRVDPAGGYEHQRAEQPEQRNAGGKPADSRLKAGSSVRWFDPCCRAWGHASG